MAETKQRPIVVSSAVRRWAAAEGIQVGKRGKIPDEVIQWYRRAKSED